MQYSFACPLEGCGQKMTVEAGSRDEAVEKLTEVAKEHLASQHPEVQKSDEQVREDISTMTVEESSDESPDDEG